MYIYIYIYRDILKNICSYMYVDRRISLASVGLGLSLVGFVMLTNRRHERSLQIVRTFSPAPCKLLHPSI